MKFMMLYSWWLYKINLFNVFFLVEAASKLEPCVCLHQFLPASLSPFPNQCRPVLHVLQRTSDQHPKSCRFHDTCCLAANESHFTFFLASTNHCSRSMTGLHSILSMHVNSSHIFFQYHGCYILELLPAHSFLHHHFSSSIHWQCNSVSFFCVHQWPTSLHVILVISIVV